MLDVGVRASVDHIAATGPRFPPVDPAREAGARTYSAFSHPRAPASQKARLRMDPRAEGYLGRTKIATVITTRPRAATRSPYGPGRV
jgi:hypothetical protein